MLASGVMILGECHDGMEGSICCAGVAVRQNQCESGTAPGTPGTVNYFALAMNYSAVANHAVNLTVQVLMSHSQACCHLASPRSCCWCSSSTGSAKKPAGAASRSSRSNAGVARSLER
jgi:hypothetical protein